MNKRIGFLSLFVIVALVLATVGAITALAAPSGVAGSIKLDRSWATLAKTVKVTVTDTDLDVPIFQREEGKDYFGADYTTAANGSNYIAKVKEAPISDWVDWTADNCCGTGKKFASANDFLGFFGLTQDAAISTADLDAVNKPGALARKNAQANYEDVIVRNGATGETLTNATNTGKIQVFGIDSFNGVITFRVTDATAASITSTISYFGSVINTTTVTVKSTADPVGFALTLKETARSGGIMEATFGFAAATDPTNNTDPANATRPKIKATAGVVATAEYSDTSDATTRTASVTIEEIVPDVGNLAPLTKYNTNLKDVTLSADATDGLSGIKSGTLKFYICVPTEADCSETGEANYREVKDSDDALDDVASKFDTNKYTTAAITGGTRATVKVTLQAAAGTYKWFAKVEDVAGNVGKSIGDPDVKDGQGVVKKGHANPHEMVYDITTLALGTDADSGGVSAVTGQWYDATKATGARLEKTASKAKNTSIRVVFDGALDCTSVAKEDFKVKDAVPLDAACYTDVANSAFLTVAALTPGETPKVEVVLGGVKDKAGNANAALLTVATAKDGIAPTLTVTLTGDATITGVPASKATVTVRITSNETVAGIPELTVVRVKSVAGVLAKDGVLFSPGTVSYIGSDTYEIKLTDVLLAAQANPNVYGAVTGSLFAAKVTAGDSAGNVGTKGGDDPTATTALLFEVDAGIPAHDATNADATKLKIMPSDKAADKGEVFRTDPFITVDWTAEGSEYAGDSHKKITLTVATLDGVSVLDKMVTTDNRTFILATGGLALGSHTFKVNGTDESGNKLGADASVTFVVKEVAKVSIALKPGQNLVSLPGEPSDSAINSVITIASVTSVIAYDPINKDPATGSPWLTATRDAAGNLDGSLKKIDARHGYWVKTSTFEAIKVEIPAQGFAALPPSVQVVAGWNLVPVVSIAGAAPGTNVSADTYLGSTKWVTAYTYDPETNAWTKILPKSFQNVVVGKGYWVYVTEDGILVP